MKRLVVWFSCGAASAVTAKLCLARYAGQYEIAIVRCVVANEHQDNDRFAADCEKWFGMNIQNICSPFYRSCWDVWETMMFLSGWKGGSPCTSQMKRKPRKIFEREWHPDCQAYGYTAEELDRVERFHDANPDIELVSPLIDFGLKKSDCLSMIRRAGIKLPMMYRLGFNNNNCVGCVKGGIGYWNRIRKHFPEIFDRMARLERKIGASCIMRNGEHLWLDELPHDAGRHKEPEIDCSLLCVGAEAYTNEKVHEPIF
jgi:hypothetical protein